MSRQLAFVDGLRSSVTDCRIEDDPDIARSFSRDAAPTVASSTPWAVAFPRNTESVQAIVRTCQTHGVPAVTRGAGSGLSGGANAVAGSLVVSMERMDQILEVDVDDQIAVVEPGVLNGDLKARVAEVGLWYPPDPASTAFSTIGGNIATNAGGLCCVKYGVTGSYVLGLEVVMADGSVLITGRRTRKSVAGYDLTRLFVGSEGTLGIVTGATLRLVPTPSRPTTLVAFMPQAAGAGAAVAEALRLGPPPSMLEFIDGTTIAAIEAWKPMGLDQDAGALVVAQSDSGEGGPTEMSVLARHLEAHGATYVAQTSDPAETEQLLTARRLAFPALERRGAVLLDDVAVPRSRVAALLDAITEIGAEQELEIGTFGHLGDGNLHPTIVYDAETALGRDRAFNAFASILDSALSLGGTITGEHGVGMLKAPFLDRELSATSLSVHDAIKRALDPANLMNPGKAVHLADAFAPSGAGGRQTKTGEQR